MKADLGMITKFHSGIEIRFSASMVNSLQVVNIRDYAIYTQLPKMAVSIIGTMSTS